MVEVPSGSSVRGSAPSCLGRRPLVAHNVRDCSGEICASGLPENVHRTSPISN
ncbi:unnamed protein product, partial [Nesidiocoris tenuis]